MSESVDNHFDEKSKILNALRLTVRIFPPLMEKIEELQCEKRILSKLTSDAWKWERALADLAEVVSNKNGKSFGLKRTIGFRSVVIAVIAANRLKAFGSEGRKKIEAAESPAPAPYHRTASRHHTQTTPEQRNIPGQQFFTPQQYQHSQLLAKRNRVGIMNSAIKPRYHFSLIPDDHIDSNPERISQKLPTLESCSSGSGGIEEFEAVINAMVLHSSEPQVNGSLIQDMSMGLFNWIRTGKRVGNFDGDNHIMSVRRGMGLMARKIKKMEDQRSSARVLSEGRDEELNRAKESEEMFSKLLDEERAKVSMLEERSQALAAECLESVPHSRVSSLNEELVHSRKIYTDLASRHAELQQELAEKNSVHGADASALDAVRDELVRKSNQLDSERKERVDVVHENQRLKSELLGLKEKRARPPLKRSEGRL